MSSYLTKVKVFFSLILCLLLFLVAAGSFTLGSNFYLTKNYANSALDYLKYRMVFSPEAFAHPNGAEERQHSAVSDLGESKSLSVPVLLYHGVISEPDGFNVLKEDFIDQMYVLKKAGWQTVSLDELLSFMEGKMELAAKSFVLTFDDGRKDSFYPVDPLLRIFDYHAVMFVITKRMEESLFHLSTNELSKMAESGRWDIESHGMNDHDLYPIDSEGTEGHFLSNRIWLLSKERLETEHEFIDRIRTDLVTSKSKLEGDFGNKVIGFAFPFGDYGQNSVNFKDRAEEIIYEEVRSVYPLAFYGAWSGSDLFNHREEEPFMVKRIEVKPEWSGEYLLSVLESGSY